MTNTDITLAEVIDMLSELFTNLNNMDKTYYDMFYNTTPMDITLERYNENGVLQTVVVPNRAKDASGVLTGSGDPEGQVPASVGKLYMNLDNSYLYYKTQGTALAPTSVGWELVYSTITVSETFQYKSEKGQPNGYAPLNEDGKVPAQYLSVSELSYWDTGDTCMIDILVKTVLTWICSNNKLDFEVTYTGTKDDIGVETLDLTENTLVTHPVREDVKVVGNVSVDIVDGEASNFSTNDYLKVPFINSALNVTLPNEVTTDVDILDIAGSKVTLKAPVTTVGVVTGRENLVVNSTFTGQKPIGEETDIVKFKDRLEWRPTVCVRQGNLNITEQGTVSGFSNANYLAPTSLYTSTDTMDIVIKTGEDITTGQVIVGNNMSLAIKDGYLGYNKLTDKTFAQVVEVTADTNYYLKFTYDVDKTTNVVKYSTDGETYTEITPAEAGNLFLLGTYALGKGILDGKNNVPFLGTIDATSCTITHAGEGSTAQAFAEVTHKWYDLEDIATTLEAHDLVLTSGEPVDGDIVTITYTTSKPKIGENEVELGSTYNLKYESDEDVYTFYPRVQVETEWKSAGDAVVTGDKLVDVGKSDFTGVVNLLQSTTGTVTENVVKNYTEVGTLRYNMGIASGFSANNYMQFDVQDNTEFTLHLKTGADVDTKQYILDGSSRSQNEEDLGTILYENSLYITSGGQVQYIRNGTLADTTLIVTANTEYTLKFTKDVEAHDWNLQYSTDGENWTSVTYDDLNEFGDLMSSDTRICQGDFVGTVDVHKSKLTGVALYTLTRTLGEQDLALVDTVINYRWFDNENVEHSLDEVGLKLVAGTPVTGDTLALTYTTTEK